MSAAPDAPVSVRFDPRSAEYLGDPYAHLGRLRRQGRVCVDEGTGLWFVLRFGDVQDALTHITRRMRDDDGHEVHFPANPFAADGPPHMGPRRLVMPTFTNKAVQEWRGRAQAVVDAALAGKEAGGELRVVEEIGYPLPYVLTCAVLGVPEVTNEDELREWTWRSLELIDAFLPPDQVQRNVQAAGFLAAHLREVIAWKRDHLADDLLSSIIAAADAGEVLSTNELVSFVHTLYLAGMHTTVNQTALSLNALFTHRDQWELLVGHPDLLENAVEELLRFEPTAQYMRRSVVEDYSVGDVTVPAGTEVVCWIASANRDEDRWGPEADVLDITRPDARQHVSFGRGPHMCLGSWLARLELQVVAGTLSARFPRSGLPDQELTWTSNVIRGPEELVVELVP